VKPPPMTYAFTANLPIVLLLLLTEACAACKCCIAISAFLVFSFNSFCAAIYNLRFVFAISVNWRSVFLALFNFLAAASEAAFFSASIFLAASIWACVGFGVAATATEGVKDKVNKIEINFLAINLPHPVF